MSICEPTKIIAEAIPFVAPKMVSHETSAPAVWVTLASASAPVICEMRALTSITRRPTRWRTWPAIRLASAKASANAE